MKVKIDYQDPAICRAILRRDLEKAADGASIADALRDPLADLRGAIWPEPEPLR